MQKNYRRIPKSILDKISLNNGQNFIVSTVFQIGKNEVDNPRFNKLDLKIHNNELVFIEEFIPEKTSGSYSKKNVDGYKIIHRDREKVSKTYYMGERPVFGDWSKGSFSLYVKRKVFPFDLIAPKDLSIKTELIKTDKEGYTIKVFVDNVLNRKSVDFEKDLLFSLNLLQENFYSVDIFDTDTTYEEYLASISLTWDIFPPGTKEEDLNKICNGVRRITEEKRLHIERNYEYFTSLKPLALINGKSGMRRYFGAKFSDNLVVFENLHYGNAIYVLFENWEELSKLSRTEIQSRPSDQFIRIRHTRNWQSKLEKIIEKKR